MDARTKEIVALGIVLALLPVAAVAYDHALTLHDDAHEHAEPAEFAMPTPEPANATAAPSNASQSE